jgi:phenylalanyl-tRNA synthetase beta chain
VAIGLGYDNLPEQLPKEARFGDALKSRKLENRCRETMLGIGFQEVVTLTLTSTDMLHNSTGRESDNEATVSNPVTEDYHMLRSSILPNLIELLKNNRHRELPQKIFEVGQVVREHSNRTSLSWIELASKATFSNARSTAEIISQRLGLNGDLNDEEDPLFIPGRCVQIKSDNFTLKYGEIHPRTLEKFELGYPAIGGEINW